MEHTELLIARTVVHGQDAKRKLENQNLLMHNLEQSKTAGALVRILPIC